MLIHPGLLVRYLNADLPLNTDSCMFVVIIANQNTRIRASPFSAECASVGVPPRPFPSPQLME